MKKENALDAAKKIKMLVFDVDGVMTDGSITYDENGVEYKTFNAKDGHGVIRMRNSGFVTAIITARNNGTVQHRAKNLNFTELYQGRKYKLPALMELMEKYNLSYENISYMEMIFLTYVFWKKSDLLAALLMRSKKFRKFVILNHPWRR